MPACRVAIIDSGVNQSHPHIGNVIAGINLQPQGPSGDFTDRIGHGTAVAGAIHEKAPAAEILVVKVFDRSLAANIDQLVDGISWALDNGADIINLSLGTTNVKHKGRLGLVIEKAARTKSRIVSARRMLDVDCYPGCMEGVLGVEADVTIPRDRVRFTADVAFASPYPRPIPGVAPERNLSGVSFAVANVSGFLCVQIISARNVTELCGAS